MIRRIRRLIQRWERVNRTALCPSQLIPGIFCDLEFGHAGPHEASKEFDDD